MFDLQLNLTCQASPTRHDMPGARDPQINELQLRNCLLFLAGQLELSRSSDRPGCSHLCPGHTSQKLLPVSPWAR